MTPINDRPQNRRDRDVPAPDDMAPGTDDMMPRRRPEREGRGRGGLLRRVALGAVRQLLRGLLR